MNKQMITVAVVVMFGISAATTSFVKSRKAAEDESPQKAGEQEIPLTESELANLDGNDQTPAAIIRPEYLHNSQSVNLLATKLKARLKDEESREVAQKMRQHSLELIHYDFLEHQQSLKDERRAMEDSLVDAIQRLKDAKSAYKKQQEEDRSKSNKKQTATVVIPADEKRMVRKLGLVFNSMPAESAASIVSRLADEGEFETIVKVLGTMRERDAKNVLAKIEQGFERDGVESQANPKLAADLTRQYLTLRKPAIQ